MRNLSTDLSVCVAFVHKVQPGPFDPNIHSIVWKSPTWTGRLACGRCLIEQITSICRLRSAHYEVKIHDSKSASFLQKNHIIISNKASTNIIAVNGSLDQRIWQNASIHRLRSTHYEVKSPDSKSESFLQKNNFIISSKSSTNKIITQNGSSYWTQPDSNRSRTD